MAKTKISEFSSTPGNNTDIDGINIAEGCAPSGINNAIRELMSQLKDWQAGTSNDPMVIGSTGSLTLSYGTANGVTYLNGSKVLTSGSALVFDGTNLGVGTSSTLGNSIVNAVLGFAARNSGATPGYFQTFNSNAGADLKTWRMGGDSSGNLVFETVNDAYSSSTNRMTLSSAGNLTLPAGTANGVAYLNGSKVLTTGTSLVFDGSMLTVNRAAAGEGIATSVGSGAVRLDTSVTHSGTGVVVLNAYPTGSPSTASQMVWQLGGSEQMRLTSTGLGIGTSSPDSGFQLTAYADVTGAIRVRGGGAGSNSARTASLSLLSSGNEEWIVRGANDSLRFIQGSTERARFDLSGNLGLGVTPSAWSTSAQTALQVYTAGVSGNGGGNTASRFTHGAYLDGSTWRYQYSGVAPARYEITGPNSGSTHSWSIAAGGTAGNAISFTQAMTLDASGNLGVGTTSPAGRLDIGGSGSTRIFVRDKSDADRGIYLDSGTAATGVALVSTNTANRALGFATNDTERARIDSSGQMTIGATGNYGSRLSVYGSIKRIVAVAGTSGSPAEEAGLLYDDGSVNRTGIYFFNNFQSASDSWMSFKTMSGGTTAERARIDSSGNLLVGTTSFTAAKMAVSTAGVNNGIYSENLNTASTNHTLFWGKANGVDRFYVLGNGNVQNTNNSYGALSDAKLKENVTDATPKLEKLNQVRIVTYNLKTDPDQKLLGVIAQELEQVFPSMVDETPDRDAEGNELGTTTKSVKYSVFVPMLIKAMQEQQAIINQLKARLDAANL